MRSTFQLWKNSWAAVLERAELLVRAREGAAGSVRMVLLRCSIAVGLCPRQKIGDEGVRLLEGRQLAEHRALFAHDLLESGRKPVGIGVAAVVMERDAKLAIDRERPRA